MYSSILFLFENTSFFFRIVVPTVHIVDLYIHLLICWNGDFCWISVFYKQLSLDLKLKLNFVLIKYSEQLRNQTRWLILINWVNIFDENLWRINKYLRKKYAWTDLNNSAKTCITYCTWFKDILRLFSLMTQFKKIHNFILLQVSADILTSGSFWIQIKYLFKKLNNVE